MRWRVEEMGAIDGAAAAQVGLGPDRVIYVEAGDEHSVLGCFEEGRLCCSGTGAALHDGVALLAVGRGGLRHNATRHLYS